MSRIIRITVQLTIDKEMDDSPNKWIENDKSLGELAHAWWQSQKKVTSFGGKAICAEAEIIDIEEPKAKRYSAAFMRALEKKRAKVKEIWGEFWV
ncbi:MAG: hypothetical protein ACO24D_14805 [bacterium]